MSSDLKNKKPTYEEYLKSKLVLDEFDVPIKAPQWRAYIFLTSGRVLKSSYTFVSEEEARQAWEHDADIMKSLSPDTCWAIDGAIEDTSFRGSEYSHAIMLPDK